MKRIEKNYEDILYWPGLFNYLIQQYEHDTKANLWKIPLLELPSLPL